MFYFPFLKYKKLTFIFFIFVISIFLSPLLDLVLNYLTKSIGIYSAIIVGFFYSLSFTSGASAVTLTSVNENFFLFSLLSGFGAMLADLTILRILKSNLHDEINSLGITLCKKLKVKRIFPSNKLLRFSIGIIILGSPLPDELGVYLLDKSNIAKGIVFLIVSFVANFTFILILTYI